MKIHQFIIFAIIALIFIGCDNDENNPEEPLEEIFLFEDGFETQNDLLDELFPSNGNRWSTIQKTDPKNTTNEISISNTEFNEGQNALKVVAYQSDSDLSKIDIEKNGLNII